MLALLHIPKTGGSSLVKTIRSEYGEPFRKSPNAIVDPVLAEAKLRALGEAADGSRPPAVAGHIVFGMRDLLPPDTRYLTVLREPVERTLSHYAYLVAPRDPRSRPHGLLARGTPYRPEMTLEQCLDDPRYLSDNFQTRMIVSRRSPFEPLPADALEQAKDHLAKRFAHVGVTERLDEMTALLTTAYGWPSRVPARTRVSRGRARRSDIALATLRAVERSNMLDVELYEFACSLFDRAVEEGASEVRLELDVLRRAAEREGGAAPATPPRGDLRARLVDARAELVVRVTRESQPLLVQIHIPKTAGSALRRLLGRQYGDGFRKAPNTFTHPEVAEGRLRARVTGENNRPLAIAGHIVFGLRDVLPADSRYVTVLREPVERTLSHYGYLVAPRDPKERQHGLLARDTPYRPELSLEEALEDPRYLPGNLQTRMIVCRRSPFEQLPGDALEQAKEHLRSRFAFVGVTERFDEFAALLARAFGWAPRVPPRKRVGDLRPERASMSREALRALEEHDALDLELYALASELQEQALARAPG